MTTNNFRTFLVATFAQYNLIRKGLALAQVQSTAARTVSEYSGLGKRVSEEVLAHTPGAPVDETETAKFSCNLEELKSMRRAVRKLLDNAPSAAPQLEAIAVVETLLNAAITTFNHKRLEGGKQGRADLTA